MNLIAKLLPPSNILLDLDVTSKKRMFEQAGLLFENNQGVARSLVFDSLFARERLGSTGLGQGRHTHNDPRLTPSKTAVAVEHLRFGMPDRIRERVGDLSPSSQSASASADAAPGAASLSRQHAGPGDRVEGRSAE